MKKFTMAIAAAATSLCAASPAAAVTLINGSFEQGTNPGAFTGLARNNSTAITGWTVGNNAGGIDYIGTYWTAAGGSRSVDLSGSGRGSIFQDVATTVGQMYRVTFFMAGNPDGGPARKEMTVSILGGDSETFSFLNSAATTRANMGWVQHTFDFTAEDTVSRLTFATSERVVAGRPSSPYGPALDNVSIAAVPEPATWGMMILGFGLMGFGMRRRRGEPRIGVRFA